MEEIIDKYLAKWISKGLNTLPGLSIQAKMADPKQSESEEWKIWYPIPSTVQEREIKEFEEKINIRLPDSYKRLLRHKHFYELIIYDCSFFAHPINEWLRILTEKILNEYSWILESGKIPFAEIDSSNYLYCFDSTVERENNEYPIVVAKFEEFEFEYSNFEQMLTELDIKDKSQQWL